MNQSKVLLLIVILVAIGAVALLTNCTKQSSSVNQSTKLPVKEKISTPKEEKLEAVKVVEIEKMKNEIKTIAKGEIIKYQEESFYSEGNFAVILENQNEFKSQLIEKFREGIIGAEALNCDVELNQFKKSVILRCDVKGAMYGTNSYNMHFLLNGTKRFGFDLYGFKEAGKRFIYEGKINGISTKIVFEFPYEFGHCHEHVWPKR